MSIVATVTTSLMTFEEFERLPETPGKQELLRGELIELPPAKKCHDDISHRLFMTLLATGSPGEVRHETSYRISRNPESWLVPDVSITHPGQPFDDYFA